MAYGKRQIFLKNSGINFAARCRNVNWCKSII